MQVEISARHGQLGDATKEKIKAKVERLSRLFDRLQTISVTVDLEKEQAPRVEVLIVAEHTHNFVASDTSLSVLAALDGVIHKLEQQLRKYKEKLQEHHRAPRPEPAPLDSGDGTDE